MTGTVTEIQRLHRVCVRTEAKLARERRRRDAAIRAACSNGVSQYAVAKATGMTGRGVKKIVERKAT